MKVAQVQILPLQFLSVGNCIKLICFPMSQNTRPFLNPLGHPTFSFPSSPTALSLCGEVLERALVSLMLVFPGTFQVPVPQHTDQKRPNVGLRLHAAPKLFIYWRTNYCFELGHHVQIIDSGTHILKVLSHPSWSRFWVETRKVRKLGHPWYRGLAPNLPVSSHITCLCPVQLFLSPFPVHPSFWCSACYLSTVSWEMEWQTMEKWK